MALRQLCVLQVGHHVFDLFGMVAVSHQQSVGRVDDEQVLRAQGHHGAPGRVDVGVARGQCVALAVNTVARFVGRGQVGHGVPAAHIAPLAHKGDHGHVGVVFHHGVVDALRAAGQEGVFLRADEVGDQRVGVRRGRFGGGAGHGGLAAGQNVGRVRGQRRQQHAGPSQEDARIPQHVALQQQGLGGFGLGLFNEASHRTAAVGPRITLLGVAIGRARKAGHNAKGDDGASQRGGHALLHHGGKGGGVGNVVVGRAEQQQRVGLRYDVCTGLSTGMDSGQGHGGGGVAAGGFQVVNHQKAVVFGRHAQQRGAVGHQGKALGRQAQQAFVANERHKLFGVAFAAERPQPGARTTTGDDGGNLNHAF